MLLFRSLNQLSERSVVRIDDKKIFDTASKKSIDVDLSIFDSDDTARASVHNIILHACTVAKDNNQFVLTFGSNQGLKALDPKTQSR